MAIRYGTRQDTRDGPNPKTAPKLLDSLATEDIKAMFFVLGERIATAEGRAIMERAHREGHHIGNHTYSHPNLKTLSEEEIRNELRRPRISLGIAPTNASFSGSLMVQPM